MGFAVLIYRFAIPATDIKDTDMSKTAKTITRDGLTAGAAFDDMWKTDDVDWALLVRMTEKHPQLVDRITSIKKSHSDSVVAYIAYMTQQLFEMHRVLNPTGGIYLHRDPTAGHYLKIVMDFIFSDGENFRNEIIWFHHDTPVRPKKNFARALGGRPYIGGKSASEGKIPESVWRIPLVGRAMSDNLNKGLVVTFGSIGAPAGFVRRLVDAHAVKDFSNACALPNQNLSADNLYKALSGWAEKFGARQSAAGVKADGDIKNGRKACCRYGQIYAVFLAGDVGGAVPKMRQLLCVLGVAIFGLAARKNCRGLRPPAPVEQRPSPLNIRP